MKDKSNVDYEYKVVEVKSGIWTYETRLEAIEDVLN